MTDEQRDNLLEAYGELQKAHAKLQEENEQERRYAAVLKRDWENAEHERDEARAQLARVQERNARLEQACDGFEKNSADATQVWEDLQATRRQLTQVQAELEAWKQGAAGKTFDVVDLEKQLAQVKAEAASMRRHLQDLLNFCLDNTGLSALKTQVVKQALSAEAGKGYHHESECQAWVDAAVRATWEEAAKVVDDWPNSNPGHMLAIAAALRARGQGEKP